MLNALSKYVVAFLVGIILVLLGVLWWGSQKYRGAQDEIVQLHQPAMDVQTQAHTESTTKRGPIRRSSKKTVAPDGTVVTERTVETLPIGPEGPAEVVESVKDVEREEEQRPAAAPRTVDRLILGAGKPDLRETRAFGHDLAFVSGYSFANRLDAFLSYRPRRGEVAGWATLRFKPPWMSGP